MAILRNQSRPLNLKKRELKVEEADGVRLGELVVESQEERIERSRRAERRRSSRGWNLKKRELKVHLFKILHYSIEF